MDLREERAEDPVAAAFRKATGAMPGGARMPGFPAAP